MRIGAALLSDGQFAYQSHEWRFFRSAGGLDGYLGALTAIEVDEILVITRPTRSAPVGTTTIDLIKALASKPVPTPCIIGGGVSSSNVEKIIEIGGADRYCFSSDLVVGDFTAAQIAIDKLGKQAVLGCLPFRLVSTGFEFYITANDQWVSICDSLIKEIGDLCDEVVLYDTAFDGQSQGFRYQQVLDLPLDPRKSIWIGGVGEEVLQAGKSLGLASAIIENRLLHRDRSRRHIR